MRAFKSIVAAAAVAVIAFCGAEKATAETVSQKQAAQIAETFFNAAYGEYSAKPKFVWNGRQLTTDRLFSPFYVYNHPKGGFVIIAADSKAYPILGYSKTTNFNREKLTDDERGLLSKYAHEVELIRYDSRIPERAVAAWQNIPLHINKALTNPYESAEFEALDEEAREKLEAIDRRNNSIMMPSAVEFNIYNPDNFRSYTLDDVTAPNDTDEYIPFKFYEDFLEEIAEEERTRAASLDEIISPTKPVVEILGGAHYSIHYPVDVRMATVYSLQGHRVIERYFKNTNTVNLDLSSLPVGFYALMVLGEDGKIYGYKVYR